MLGTTAGRAAAVLGSDVPGAVALLRLGGLLCLVRGRSAGQEHSLSGGGRTEERCVPGGSEAGGEEGLSPLRLPSERYGKGWS